MTSESTRFVGQPRDMKPTLVNGSPATFRWNLIEYRAWPKRPTARAKLNAPSGLAMKLTLQVDGALHPVTLTEDGVTIGRGDQATIRIQANAVSRVHARIFLKAGQPHVMDMKSLNGTSLT